MNNRIFSKNTIRHLVFALVIVILALLCVNILEMGVTYAADTTSNFDKTAVTDDLFYDGSKFDERDYPSVKDGDIQIINIIEYGFPFYQNQSAAYGIYVYVYNPGQYELSKIIGGSAIQMGCKYNEDGDAIGYKKYQLLCVSASDDSLFYKYKVVDVDDEIYNRVCKENANSKQRRYDISGVEIVQYGASAKIKYGIAHKSDVKTVEKTVALSLTYSGYGAGFDKDVNAKSSLTVSSARLDTQELQLNSTFFRTDCYSDTGVNHYNQLNSVYFSVDNNYLEKYGVLYGVTAEWYEYKTPDVLVTDNQTMYDALYATRGIPHEAITGTDHYQVLSSIYSSSWTGWPFVRWNGENTAESRFYHWAFNFDAAKKEFDSLGFIDYNVLYNCPMLYYVFKVNDRYNDILSKSTLIDYINNYTKSYHHGTVQVGDRTLSGDMFVDSVDEGRTRGYNCMTIYNNSDYTYDLLSYDNSDRSSFEKWFSKGNLKRLPPAVEYKDILPIREVYGEDIYNLSADTMANEYLIYKGDADSIKDFVRENEAQNRTTHLFRFAATDYYSVPVQSAWKDANKNYAYGYVSRESVFLDFDVIELTFSKDGVFKVMPVNADPIDVAGDITPPPTLPDPDTLQWWEWLLIAIAVIIGLILLVIAIVKLFPYIIEGLGELIMLPFKAFSKLMTYIRRKLDERAIKKKAKRAQTKAKGKTRKTNRSKEKR